MKKAVIQTGGKQYLVSEDDTLEIELVGDKKTIDFTPLLVIDNGKAAVGQPEVKNAVVTAEVIEQVRADKVTAIRYKAKKRVHKRKGHRQTLARIKVKKITQK